jgi:hypothetical protein
MLRKLKWQLPGEPLAVRFNWCQRPVPGRGSSRQVISSSQRPLPNNTQHSQQTDIHSPGGIRTHNFSRRAAADLRLRSRGHWDQHSVSLCLKKMWTIKFGRLYWQSQNASVFFVGWFVCLESLQDNTWLTFPKPLLIYQWDWIHRNPWQCHLAAHNLRGNHTRK